ncbi:hypothetical protein GCM10009641_14110 [Mycobacterium cookii]|uniref:Uncharacterized protein n=1 Tax=Mycobacterium cookii TaxID=1775 RepID=A0A7I7KZ54_9MYCO|nr:hypothetical protein [Mycobacterium cookii]MCV7330594.1 hypothetical protein [Mycobacterium cookii]BBX47213.1 hypothetical protein MCOO_32280 [Mycobacterium cookii]
MSMDRLRRMLARPLSVAALIEIALWLLIPHVVIGMAWATTHPDTIQALQNSWGTAVPGHLGDPALWLGASLLWPVILLLPTNCTFT